MFSRKEQTVDELKQELSMVRRDLIAMAPEDYQLILSDRRKLSADYLPFDWERDAVDAVLAALGKTLGSPANAWFSPQTPCPLCNGVRNIPGASGFAFPDGLRRHLSGSHNARKCSLMAAATKLTDSRWEANYQNASHR